MNPQRISAQGDSILFWRRFLDDISFDAPDMKEDKIVIDANYVKDKIADIVKDRDLSRYIL